jgi:hypothetical protein
MLAGCAGPGPSASQPDPADRFILACMDGNADACRSVTVLARQYRVRHEVQAQQQQLELQALTQSLYQFGASVNPYPGYAAPSYVAPQVTPLIQPGSQQVRCITAGIYTNCRY